MKNQKFLASVLLALFTITTAQVTAQAQDNQDFARMTSTASGLRFDVKAQNSGATLVIAAPDGRVYRKEFKEGSSPEFSLDEAKDRLPDGHYSYELRLAPVVSAELKTALNNGRARTTNQKTCVPLAYVFPRRRWSNQAASQFRMAQ